jgi:hypothetical protein
MNDTANVVAIRSLVSRLGKPQEKQLYPEQEASGAWDMFTEQIPAGGCTQKWLRWVLTHPVYLIEPEGECFRKRPVVLSELLQREQLSKNEFEAFWSTTDASSRLTTQQQMAYQRHTLQIAGMMWCHPVIGIAYDYQELFQSYCSFLAVVSALIDSTHDSVIASEAVIESVTEGLWASPINVRFFPGSVGEPLMQLQLSELLTARQPFVDLVQRVIRLFASAIVDDAALKSKLTDTDTASEYWLEKVSEACTHALADWLSPINRDDTCLGIRSTHEVFGDLMTYLSYRLIDSGLREGLCV